MIDRATRVALYGPTASCLLGVTRAPRAPRAPRERHPGIGGGLLRGGGGARGAAGGAGGELGSEVDAGGEFVGCWRLVA